jgi:outer membrane protein W
MQIPKHFPLTLALVFIGFTSKAQQYKYGLGLRVASDQSIVGSGVTLKYFFNEKSAVEAIVGFNPTSIGAMYAHHLPLGAPGLQWYFGGGAFGSFHETDKFGAMGVVGLDYTFAKAPVNLSVDWKPELILSKEVGFEPAAVGLSVRFVMK